MQLLTATLLRPGASSSSVISTQPRERTAKHCQTQKKGWEEEDLSYNWRSPQYRTQGVLLRPELVPDSDCGGWEGVLS